MHFQELDGQREEHRGRQRVVGQRASLPRHERVLVTGRQGAEREDEGEREGVRNGPSPPQWARTAPRPLRARVEASSTMAAAGVRGCELRPSRHVASSTQKRGERKGTIESFTNQVRMSGQANDKNG